MKKENIPNIFIDIRRIHFQEKDLQNEQKYIKLNKSKVSYWILGSLDTRSLSFFLVTYDARKEEKEKKRKERVVSFSKRKMNGSSGEEANNVFFELFARKYREFPRIFIEHRL